VLFSAVMTVEKSPYDAHAKYPLLQACHLPPCIIALPYEAATPHPLISPPHGEGHLSEAPWFSSVGTHATHASATAEVLREWRTPDADRPQLPPEYP
jgi:hypothetical protein